MARQIETGQTEIDRPALLEVVLNHRTSAASYHDHKEKSAFAAVALYLSGGALWLLDDKFWSTALSCGTMIASVLVTFVVALVVGLFTHWQLHNKRLAATIEAACVSLSTKIVAGERLEGKETTWEGLTWPAPLVTELKAAEPRVREGTRLPEGLTYALVVIWALLLLGRIVAATG